MTIQQVPSRGRISIARIQNFTLQRRQSVTKLVYGALLIIISLVMAIIDPVDTVTNWILEVKDNSLVFNMWKSPPYQLYAQAYIFNYTNVDRYLDGTDKKLKLEEIGPFTFQENRTNQDMTVDREKGILKLTPDTRLTFLKDQSVAELKDVMITVPNIAVLAISTLVADKLSYLGNAGIYYSMNAIGSKLFLNMTAHEYLYGYSDPLVDVASKLLPGWIDFKKIGIIDRFYAQKPVDVEINIKDPKKKFSIVSWDKSRGLKEKGFLDYDNSTHTKCNTIAGAFEGLMMPPKFSRDMVIKIFRKQACRIYPFLYEKDIQGKHGFSYYRYVMDDTAFNRTNPYACKCTQNCMPDGFVDISECFYGFPIALSKPHFLDVDPIQKTYFEGLHPDPVKHRSSIDIEPNLGVPLSLFSNMQVNIAVRMSTGNTITRPLKDKVMPLLWVSLYCKEPPATIITMMRLRFVIAPPLIITLEVLLFLIGLIIGAQGSYRFLRPKYKLIHSETEKPKRRKSSVVIPINILDNKGFKDDEDLAKEAVSLLAIKEEDFDLPDLLMRDSDSYASS